MTEVEKIKKELKKANEQIAYLQKAIETIDLMDKSDRIQQYVAEQKQIIALLNLINSTSEVNIPTNVISNKIVDSQDSLNNLESSISRNISSSKKMNSLADKNSELFDFEEYNHGYQVKYKGFDKKSIVVPSVYNGKAVIKISDNAFRNVNMTSITIPDSIEEIGSNVFEGCEKLRSIYLPETVKIIGKSCFRLSGIQKISLNLKTVPESCFWGCLSLKSVLLGENVMNIAADAFSNTNFESIELPENLRQFQKSSCNKLARIIVKGKDTEICGDYSYKTVIYCLNGSKALQYARDHKMEFQPLAKAFTLASSDKLILKRKIIKEREYENADVSEIEFSDKVYEIGEKSFSKCKNLLSVCVPETIKVLGEGCFSESSLEKAEIDTDISLRCFMLCKYLSTVIIGKHTTEIGIQAFWGTAIESIIIPENVHTINRMAFYNSKLKEITFEGCLTEIDGNLVNPSDKKQLTIYCHNGSNAEEYAVRNKIKHIIIGDD